MAKFDTTVQLVDMDGNAFSIIARVNRAILKAGGTKQDTEQFMNEAMDGDYDDLLRLVPEWVEVE